MQELTKYVEFVSGTPQSRIAESQTQEATLYKLYGQGNLIEGLTGILNEVADNKQIQTLDDVNTLYFGDVIYSLISGSASIVIAPHEGYLYTQNYIKLLPKAHLDSKFLVYLLNENKSIQRQLKMGLQGTTILKYTLKQLKELQLPKLPSLKEQVIIGEIYFKQLRKQALQERVAKLETTILLASLEERDNT